MYQDLKNFKMPMGFRGKSRVYVQIWWLIQKTLVNMSPQIFYGWRRFWLRVFGARIGEGVLIRPSVKITYPWKVSIGDYSWIGDDVVLYSLGNIDIGANVVVSQKSYICAGTHDYLVNTFDIISKSIKIEDEVWIATDVFVSPGVIIGEGAIVGARSSVFTDLEKGMVYIGNPAVPHKKRQKN